MTRSNLTRMLELSEDQLARVEDRTTPQAIMSLLESAESEAAAGAVYSKGVTDGLKCALLLFDGATLEEAADYMIAALTMNS